MPTLTLNICAQIAFAKVRRALIIEERRLQLSGHARSVLIGFGLSCALLSVQIALAATARQRGRRIGASHICGAASAVASIRFLIARALQHHDWLPIAQIGLIDQDGLAKLMLQHFAHNMKVGRRFPARLKLTAARHAVALTAKLHVIRYGLSRKLGNHSMHKVFSVDIQIFSYCSLTIRPA